MPYIGPVASESRDQSAGGAETQIWLLATALARRGWRVAIASHPLGTPAQVSGVDLVASGPSLQRKGPLGRAARAIALARTLTALDAPVLVQRSAGAATALAGVTATVSRRRFIYSSSSVLEFEFAKVDRRRLHVQAFRLGVLLAEEIVVQTAEQVELSRRRLGREPVVIKSLAEAQSQRQGLPEAFLWIGRLAAYKRPEAVVKLARAVPEAKFWIVPVATGAGEQDRLKNLRLAADELPNLQLHAPRPRQELGELIARSVAVLSTTESEGMPNVFLEGWARGVPALALSHDPDGVIEREGVGAFAGDSDDRFEELARSMWSKRGDQGQMAVACRGYIDREHSIEAVVDAWEKVLRLKTGEGEEEA